jgi:hypothetical protein
MNYVDIIKRIENGDSYPKIAKDLNIPVTTLKSRCIKQGINFREIKNNFIQSKNSKVCFKCKIEKSLTDFYISKSGKTAYCKSCTTKVCTDRKRKFKELCLNYKGSRCERCGYNKCNRALHFHHLDPKQKDFEISEHKSFILSEKVKEELDKCILVCANCHAEIHS